MGQLWGKPRSSPIAAGFWLIGWIQNSLFDLPLFYLWVASTMPLKPPPPFLWPFIPRWPSGCACEAVTFCQKIFSHRSEPHSGFHGFCCTFRVWWCFSSPLRINTMMLLMKSSRPFGKPPPPPKHTHTHGAMRLTVWCICPGGCVRRSQTSNWPWRTTSSLTTTPRGTCFGCQLASLFKCICLCIQFYFIDLRGKFHWMIIQCI